jgi:hypothetical protein
MVRIKINSIEGDLISFEKGSLMDFVKIGKD